METCAVAGEGDQITHYSDNYHLRVVLDTNILLSACLKPDGLEARTVALALSGAYEGCASSEILDEYRDVLLRGKFAVVREQAVTLLSKWHKHVTLVDVSRGDRIAVDEEDDRFLECAAASNAAYLVTGNLRHFPATFGTTRIVNARMFLEREFPLSVDEVR